MMPRPGRAAEGPFDGMRKLRPAADHPPLDDEPRRETAPPSAFANGASGALGCVVMLAVLLAIFSTCCRAALA